MHEFQSVDVSGNVIVLGNINGDLIVFTFVETGVIKVNTFESAGLIGESFLDLGRLEEFNYQVKYPKEAIAIFANKQIKNLNVKNEYISGDYFCEISFILCKKILTTRQRLKKNIQSDFPTQITV